MRTGFRCMYFVMIAAVTCGSLLPASQVRQVVVIADWLVHFGAYAFCGLLAEIGFERRCNRSRALLGLIVAGALIEVIQPFVGRHFGWFDLGANVCGVIGAAAVAKVFNLGHSHDSLASAPDV